MVCSMIKKGVLGTALGAGALFLLFGLSAPSYVRTAVNKARHTAQDRIPTPFQIERARDEVANLEPAIVQNRETLARAEVDVEHLEQEIAATRTNLASEKHKLLTLRNSFENGEYRLTGHGNYTDEEVRAELAHRFDHCKAVTQLLKEKETTLKARQKAVAAARLQMNTLLTTKRDLLTKLEGIEAKLHMIEATQGKNEFNFDDGALARAKQTVADLEKRLEVKARMAEIEGRFSDGSLPALEPGRDVVREIDTEFGAPVKGAEAKTADKSL